MEVRIPKSVAIVELDGAPFRNKAYTYEISSIEILKGNAAPVARPNDRISMLTPVLLNGVMSVNGEPLMLSKGA